MHTYTLKCFLKPCHPSQVRPQPSLAPDEDGEGGDFRGFGVETSANMSQQE